MVPVLAGHPNTLHWPAFIPSRQRCPEVPLSQLPRDSSCCYYPPWGDSPGRSFYVFSHSSWTPLMINPQEPQGSTGGHFIQLCYCQHSSAGLSLSCQSMGRKQFCPSLDRRNMPKSLICISSPGLIPASSGNSYFSSAFCNKKKKKNPNNAHRFKQNILRKSGRQTGRAECSKHYSKSVYLTCFDSTKQKALSARGFRIV